MAYILFLNALKWIINIESCFKKDSSGVFLVNNNIKGLPIQSHVYILKILIDLLYPSPYFPSIIFSITDSSKCTVYQFRLISAPEFS